VATWWQLGLPRVVFSSAQMSDTLPIELNSAALGIGRHVSVCPDRRTNAPQREQTARRGSPSQRSRASNIGDE
jgi:hypothetical protein